MGVCRQAVFVSVPLNSASDVDESPETACRIALPGPRRAVIRAESAGEGS